MYGLTPFERRMPDFFDPFDIFDRPTMKDCMPFKTDVRDEGDKYVLEAEMPGFEKDEIKLDVEGNRLTLSAEHSANNDDKDDKKYIRRERSYCSVRRSFDLSGVNADAINAEYKNGVLVMDLPKKQPEKPAARRLEIK